MPSTEEKPTIKDLEPVSAVESVDHGKAGTLHEHADKALEFIEIHGSVTFTPEEEKGVVHKIDRVLMPLMLVSYMIQYMDKSVMAQAAVYDLISNLHLKGQDYSWCSSIFYFGYLFFQPIGSRLLARVRLGRFVAIASLIWAVLLFSTAGAYNFAGMMVVRFFLGVAEGGISPAYVLITSTWYRKREIPMRINLWFCGNGFAAIFQAFISYGIGHIQHTSVPIWRWFFIVFGCIGLIWGVVLWIWMPDSPLTATFLTERERMIAIERLRENRTGIANPEFKRDQLREAFTDPKVWYGFFFVLANAITGTAVASFGGLIIKGFGFGNLETSLLNCPLGITNILGLMATGIAVLYFPNSRCLMQSLALIPAVIGSSCVYALPHNQRVGRLIAYYFSNLYISALTLQLALTASNIAGHTKRAATNSILFVGYSVGFIVGPQFFIAREAPRYQTGFKTMIVLYSILCVAPALYWSYVTYLNRQKRRALQDTEHSHPTVENEEFLDLTDRQQLRFVYSR